VTQSNLVGRITIVGVAVGTLVLACCGASTSGATRTTVAATTTPLASLDQIPTSDNTTLSPPVSDSTVPSLSDSTLPALSDLPKPVAPPAPDATDPSRQLGTIAIPAIGIVAPLMQGVTLSTLNRGPGHWPGSARPGEAGNVVVAGHRVSHTHPFRDLDRLKPGDQVIFTTTQGRFVYVVNHTQIVLPSALWIVEPTPTKTATLFACHPKGSTSHRIVVFLDYAPELSQPTA
jgi:sortase A